MRHWNRHGGRVSRQAYRGVTFALHMLLSEALTQTAAGPVQGVSVPKSGFGYDNVLAVIDINMAFMQSVPCARSLPTTITTQKACVEWLGLTVWQMSLQGAFITIMLHEANGTSVS